MAIADVPAPRVIKSALSFALKDIDGPVLKSVVLTMSLSDKFTSTLGIRRRALKTAATSAMGGRQSGLDQHWLMMVQTQFGRGKCAMLGRSGRCPLITRAGSSQ
jgi:hypothetical protein